MAVKELPADTDLDALKPKVRELPSMDPLDSAGGASPGRDMAAQAAKGAAQAGAGFLGMVPDLANLYGMGVDFLGRKVWPYLPGNEGRPTPQPGQIFGRGDFVPGGSGDILAAGERLSGAKLPQAETLPGAYVNTLARYGLTGGALGAGRGLLGGVVGGAMDETAGQLTAGSAYEPYARFGAGLLGLLGTGFATRPTNAGSMARDRLEGVTPQQMNEGRALMAEGQRIGVPLSAAEALPSRPLQGLASDVMASPTGAGPMTRFFDQRAATLPATIRDQIAPDIASAPGYMRAAGTRNAGQALTQESQRAGYTAANPQNIDPMALRPVIQRLDNLIMTSPADVRRPLMALRNDLIENGAPVTNINRLDTVRQTFAERINTAAQGVPQNAIRRSMQPVLDDINAALQTNPQFAAGQAAYRQGAPAAQLLRQADDALEAAARPTQAGPTRMAGVNFRNQMLGGPGSQVGQETETLIREAATRAGASADDAWRGAQRAFEVLERTGRIPGVGSQTGGRMRAAQEASQGGAVGAALDVANLSKGSVLGTARETLNNFRFRQAYRELGEVLSNPSPQAVDILQRMARLPEGSASFQLLLPQLLNTAQRVTQGAADGQ